MLFLPRRRPRLCSVGAGCAGTTRGGRCRRRSASIRWCGSRGPRRPAIGGAGAAPFTQEAHYVSREAPTNTSMLLLTWDGDLGYRATAPTAGVIRLIQQTGHGPTLGDAGKQRRPVRTWAARRRPFCLESRFRIRETVLHSNLQTSQFRSPRIPTECSTSTKHITSVLCQISLKSFHL